MIEVVIWDFNGTLLDDFDLCLGIINQMLQRRSLPVLSAEEYLENFSFPVIHYYRKVGFDFEVESYQSLAEEYMAAYQPASFDCPLRNRAIELLSSLQTQGVRQILLSATKIEFLLEQTGHFGLNRFFDEIIGMGDILGKSKLEAAANWVAGQILEPENTLLIGDTIHDYEVAQALKCKCLLLTGGHNSAARLLATGVQVSDNLDDVMQLFGA